MKRWTGLIHISVICATRSPMCEETAIHISQSSRYIFHKCDGLTTWFCCPESEIIWIETLTSERITRTNIQRRQATHNYKAHTYTDTATPCTSTRKYTKTEPPTPAPALAAPPPKIPAARQLLGRNQIWCSSCTSNQNHKVIKASALISAAERRVTVRRSQPKICVRSAGLNILSDCVHKTSVLLHRKWTRGLGFFFYLSGMIHISFGLLHFHFGFGRRDIKSMFCF